MTHFPKIGDNSENNLKYGFEIMGIEISDDELLAMDPQLLLELQRHLKDYREKNGKTVISNAPPNLSHQNPLTTSELIPFSKWEIADATFEEVELPSGKFLGTKVTQNNVCYIARGWRMTSEVKSILQHSVRAGFDKFWRFGHPQDSYHEGNSNFLRGSHHIGCSKSHDTPWVFVIGAESLSRKQGKQTVKEITFNRVFEVYMDVALSSTGDPIPPVNGPLTPGSYKVQKGGGKCFTTHPDDFEKIIKYFGENMV